MTGQGKKEKPKVPAPCVYTYTAFPLLLEKEVTSLRKGGDPAALSSTTTLLRLHPPHGAYLGQRPPCG